ncbi:MAG: FliH/SctL family protein [Bacillota bacterium]|nr:FliH/SctL family protein [Bacillota bacterium]
MSSKIFKNYQVNVGLPFQVKSPLNFDTIQKVNFVEQAEEEIEHTAPDENPEEIINKANEQAEVIIEEARLEAEKLITNAENELNQLRKAVEEEAWQKGYEDGTEASRKQFESTMTEAEAVREQARADYKTILESAEADTVETILEIAKMVIGMEISFNKEDILYLVKQAFDKCSNKDNMILKVSPEDYEYVIANLDRLKSMLEGAPEFSVKKDASLKNGDCLVETSFGTVNAGVQTKLDNIEKAFRQVMGK